MIEVLFGIGLRRKYLYRGLQGVLRRFGNFQVVFLQRVGLGGGILVLDSDVIIGRLETKAEGGSQILQEFFELSGLVFRFYKVLVVLEIQVLKGFFKLLIWFGYFERFYYRIV